MFTDNFLVGLTKKLSFGALIGLGLASCNQDHDNNPNSKYDVVYLQTNDFNPNQNAVLAYKDAGDGNLRPLMGSPFMTGGSGLGNPEQILGPADSDNELRLSPDGKYLLTVNSGSNSIAVFSIQKNGTLMSVAGSPFPSGGETPVSIDISGNTVYVVNKSQNPLKASVLKPNYTSFTLNADGSLTANANSTFETTPGTSPTQILVSRDGKYAFGDDFLGFMLPTPVGTLRSFKINDGAKLDPIAGTPYILPAGAMPDNGALGLWQHPSGNPLYVGIPVQGKVGVFDINGSTGQLTLKSTVAAGAAACWIKTNSSGNRLYVLNSANNTVQVYNTEDAFNPSSIQVLELKQSGPEYAGPGGAPFKTSQDFSLYFSPSGKSLYVVSQHTNKDFAIGNYNYLHKLSVAGDGKLSEEGEPIQIPVPANVRPKGTAVISAR